MRHNTLIIHKERILHNIRNIKKKLYPNQQILAIVKANGYGTDLYTVASILLEEGISFFGVASIYEALHLKKGFPIAKVLVLSPPLEDEITLYVENDIVPTITDMERARLIDRIAHSKGKIIKAHIKVDTGMGRLGVVYDEAFNLIREIKDLKNIELEGLFTHFPSADIKDDFTLHQIDLFKNLIKRLSESRINFKYLHSANSGGIIFYNDSFFNLVRPGLLIYGGYSSDIMKDQIQIQTSIEWISRILEIKKIKKGSSVSYGRTFIAPSDMKIGIVGVGYADGLLSLNSNKGFLYINNKKAKIIGRVCMDYTIVDLSDIEAKVGDKATICDEKDGIRINDIALRSGLIPYEVLTSINCNIKRVII